MFKKCLSPPLVIFHDDDDRRFFLATLSEACAMTGWRVHAWVLMGSGVKDLAGLKGSDPRKLALAELLWNQTTVSQEWIAKKRNVIPILSEFAP